MRIRRAFSRINFIGVGVFCLIFVLWQVLVSHDIFGTGGYLSLPTPIEIINKGFKVMIDNGTLKKYTLHTLGVVVKSWLIGAVGFGVVVGLIVGMSSTFYSWTAASFDFMRSLPAIAFVPIVTLVWGSGATSEIILGVWAAFWPMMLNIAGGVRAVSPRLTDVARTFRLSKIQTIRKIILPAVAPMILVGARLSMAVCLIVVIVFEQIGTPYGLGWGVTFSNQATQYEQMWACALTIGILGVTLNLILKIGSRYLFPGVSKLQRGDL
jgi:ABC-type nitrate/sulfonate/bicarbonate transport system permease component